MLIDTHCHLNAEQFTEDVNATLQRAISEGVKKMIVIGFDKETIAIAEQLASKYDEVFLATAWHPVDVVDLNDDNMKILENSWSHPKLVAIGETGLDYYWDKSPHELQQQWFVYHVEKAIELGLPFAVHNRDAHADVLTILQEMYEKHGPLTGIMHSYSGSVEMARSFLKLGLHLSISGVVTFKNAKNVVDVVREVPMDKLLIETDAPYLTPVPFRGKRNEPAYVKYVAEKIAEIRSISYDEVAKITTENAEKLFNI